MNDDERQQHARGAKRVPVILINGAEEERNFAAQCRTFLGDVSIGGIRYVASDETGAFRKLVSFCST